MAVDTAVAVDAVSAVAVVIVECVVTVVAGVARNYIVFVCCS